jgi:hypothetical protein
VGDDFGDRLHDAHEHRKLGSHDPRRLDLDGCELKNFIRISIEAGGFQVGDNKGLIRRGPCEADCIG